MAKVSLVTGSSGGLGRHIAEAVLADMEEPHLRFILGSEANAHARAAAVVRSASDTKWHELSESTDRNEATSVDRDPLGTRGGDAP
jgi:NAD(P)-dependent dehydrogenase (short-subunit alcohol dehydrogenase family)